MTDSIQKLLKFANTVFVLGSLFSILIVIYAVYRINDPYSEPDFIGYERLGSSTFYYMSILFGGILATLFGLGLKLNDHLKMNLSVLFVSTSIAVYGVETYLEFSYETRTRYEVLEDLVESGVKAYPTALPRFFIKLNGLNTADTLIYPLGGVSKITNIFTNESGFYPVIQTDEHGFNNPIGLYKKNKVDIVLTGDSFAEGYSVHPDETIGAVLLKSGFNTLSFGKGGNGALIKLATLKEYSEPLEPKIVLWIHHGNDLRELKNEMTSSLLRKYLNEDDFTQNLISRQDEVDSVLIDYIQGKWEKERERLGKRRWINHWAMRISKLSNLRSRINLAPTLESTPLSIPTYTYTLTYTPIFKDVLQKSKQMVSRWGGKLYFVYLSGHNQYSTGKEDISRESVLRATTELGIPIIDIHEEVFVPHPDPLSLFPFRMDGHYNANGYRLVAEAIRSKLEADGIISKNLEK